MKIFLLSERDWNCLCFPIPLQKLVRVWLAEWLRLLVSKKNLVPITDVGGLIPTSSVKVYKHLPMTECSSVKVYKHLPMTECSSVKVYKHLPMTECSSVKVYKHLPMTECSSVKAYKHLPMTEC